MSDEPSRHGLARHHRAMSAAAAATSDTPILIDCGELFNLMQAHRSGGWPSGGPPTIFDVRRDSIRKHVIRGSHAVGSLSTAPPKSWWDKHVVVVDGDACADLSSHPVVKALQEDGQARSLSLLSEPFAAFREACPFLCARADSHSASKRPHSYPSCIVPGLLYLGDLSDAASLPRLREHLNVTRCVTALAELTPSLKEGVAESRVKHTWCNVRDVEQADIKEHFAAAHAAIEAARADGAAVLVHCSRGVSRSASLCIAYLMKREGWAAAKALEHVRARRPIVLPNEGFEKCLAEWGKEVSGERSGVYVPAKTQRLEDNEFELPPSWAAPPTHTRATLEVAKGDEALESLEVGGESMYVFGRSLTCDFAIEHPSASRQHAALIHHANGNLYAVDLKSSHRTFVDGKPIKPHEATRIRDGAVLTFGASTRTYTLRGASGGGGGGGASSSRGEAASSSARAGEIVPFAATAAAIGGGADADGGGGGGEGGAGKKKKKSKQYWDEHKKERKRQRILGGGKKQMTENERVSMSAGAGTGCMGPGEY